MRFDQEEIKRQHQFEEEQNRGEIKVGIQRHCREEMRDLLAPKQESVVRENLLKKVTKFNGKHF